MAWLDLQSGYKKLSEDHFAIPRFVCPAPRCVPGAGEEFESLRVPGGAVERARGRRVLAASTGKVRPDLKKPGKSGRIKGECVEPCKKFASQEVKRAAGDASCTDS